jgi:hypothetical protein
MDSITRVLITLTLLLIIAVLAFYALYTRILITLILLFIIAGLAFTAAGW